MVFLTKMVKYSLFCKVYKCHVLIITMNSESLLLKRLIKELEEIRFQLTEIKKRM